jgi:hypothetical protein
MSARARDVCSLGQPDGPEADKIFKEDASGFVGRALRLRCSLEKAGSAITAASSERWPHSESSEPATPLSVAWDKPREEQACPIEHESAVVRDEELEAPVDLRAGVAAVFCDQSSRVVGSDDGDRPLTGQRVLGEARTSHLARRQPGRPASRCRTPQPEGNANPTPRSVASSRP